MQNALTIDVEDYFQVASLARWAPGNTWDDFPLRVEQNTQRIIELFEQHNVKATFFVLGWVADRCPQLVNAIVNAGHELGSHGYSHQLIYNQTQEVFREETIRSKKLLEDISGVEVKGYRAASYSITHKSLWALDIIAEAGFQYDSSIFPVKHDRYGIPDAETLPHRLTSPKGHLIGLVNGALIALTKNSSSPLFFIFIPGKLIQNNRDYLQPAYPNSGTIIIWMFAKRD